MKSDDNGQNDLKLLSLKEVSTTTNISVRTLQRLLDANEFPPPRMLGDGRRGRWTLGDIRQWQETLRTIGAKCDRSVHLATHIDTKVSTPTRKRPTYQPDRGEASVVANSWEQIMEKFALPKGKKGGKS